MDSPKNETVSEQPLPQTPVDIVISSSALLLMAVLCVYYGSYAALHSLSKGKKGEKKGEIVGKEDAMMFPIIGSGVLLGLFFVFKYIAQWIANIVLTVYFTFVAFYALHSVLKSRLLLMFPFLQNLDKRVTDWRPKRPFSTQDLFVLQFSSADLIIAPFTAALIAWYAYSKHWMLNNFLALAFVFEAMELIHIGGYYVGLILLGGLFFYDIFWVFGSGFIFGQSVMVVVAKSLNFPVKVLFPRSLFAAEYQFALLGLGDIVLPGIYVALLLRFDRYLAGKKGKKVSGDGFSKPYFITVMVSYTLAVIMAMVVMHVFKAGQPVLLYISPMCLGSVVILALYRGQFRELWGFDDSETVNEKSQ